MQNWLCFHCFVEHFDLWFLHFSFVNVHIFFAGPLTNLINPEKTKSFYDQLSQVAKDEGFTYFWAFRSGTDPVANPDVPAAEVYRRDVEQLGKSDVMVAYVGEPSTGTGEEVEFAHANGVPVVLLYQKDQHVSRMLRGNPAVKREIVYETETDALATFRTLLKEIARGSKLN